MSGLKSNTLTYSYLAVFFITAYCLFATFFAGLASENIALSSVFNGFKLPIREPLNLLIVSLFYLVFPNFFRKIETNQIKWGGPYSNLFGISIPIVLLLLVWGFFYISGSLRIDAVIYNSQTISFPLLVSFVFLLIHGCAEQLLINKIAQEILIKKFGFWLSVFLTGLMFAILQAMQGYLGLIYILNSIAFGSLLAIMALQFGFMAAAIAHGIWTWAEVIVLPQIIQYELVPNLISGGGKDSYSSPIFTIVALVLCFALGVLININYRQNHD